jgi:hypothetical protein
MAPSYNGAAPQKETDPEKQTTAYKVARLLVIVLSALIVLGLLALVAGIAMNLSGNEPGRTHAPAAVPANNPTLYQLPPGSRILDMDSQPGRLIVRVQGTGAEEIDIFDTQDGRLVGQVKADRGGD